MEIKEKLLKMCIEIFACNELDLEVTLGGNGTNPSEASNVANRILDILEVKFSDIEDEVQGRTTELEVENGF